MTVSREPNRILIDVNGSCDSLVVTRAHGGFRFQVEESGAGDTETGFGAVCGLTIPHEEAGQLVEWLKEALK